MRLESSLEWPSQSTINLTGRSRVFFLWGGISFINTVTPTYARTLTPVLALCRISLLSPDEKARILAAGGRVFAVEYDDGVDGPPRVWLGHMDVPGLAMSR